MKETTLAWKKRRITMSRGGVQGQKEDHQQQKLHAGQRELRELADNLPILSTIAYKSPHPVKHTISMTDLIDNDPRLLQKLRMLNKIPLGPHSDEKHLKLLRDDISDIFSVTSQIGDGSCGDDTTSIADSITFATESMDDASSVEASDEQRSLSGIEEEEVSVVSGESLTRSQAQPKLQTQTSNQSIPSFSNESQESQATVRSELQPNRSITPDQKFASKMGNENYRRTHQKAARMTENTARKRVMKKIDNEKASRAKEALEKNLARS